MQVVLTIKTVLVENDVLQVLHPSRAVEFMDVNLSSAAHDELVDVWPWSWTKRQKLFVIVPAVFTLCGFIAMLVTFLLLDHAFQF